MPSATVPSAAPGPRRPDPAELTAVAQDYLKAVWSALEWVPDGHAKVSTGQLADRLGVGPSTVSEAVQKLSEQGLLVHEPYRGVGLTDVGLGYALVMVRRHRLLETWLVEQLGYTWDEVHDEAERLEHAVSDRLVERLDDLLGRPARDPHGDPIPTADGRVVRPEAVPLVDLAAGESGVVARISDADPDDLRALARTGIALDVHLTVTALLPRRDAVTLAWGGETADVAARLVSRVWVTRA
ncbi:iron (metal) dependent repressor, DtxR family [Xylanimonas cellulosilytica DSM 15894]|uniref:Manganese transport regulator n=1 Tax=Xylanimonas cellulosilytica (strain DSM 15894 / JCM 12276 / CECT 5975 / KCTC 9989 / LMG 20990 / NBRC 107835 / XIL07) TaxID=446471 RepID=D1BV05_XYLCX|nr:metal-dependent transcriptional regulator [Xylanimonas cellulosilytica]ACZ31244.1 iron (metal) dependent repressor, DtxR family [Xylanimonas cellulosilytica DSM 15894]